MFMPIYGMAVNSVFRVNKVDLSHDNYGVACFADRANSFSRSRYAEIVIVNNMAL